MPKKTTTPSSFRPSQQQILYTLLLVAIFLVGYLFATVQGLKGGSKEVPAAAPTQAAAAQIERRRHAGVGEAGLRCARVDRERRSSRQVGHPARPLPRSRTA